MTPDLDQRLDAARAAKLSPAKRALLELRLAQRHADSAASPEPPGGVRQFPLPTAARRTWLLDQLQPGTTAHVAHEAIRIHGSLDPTTVERAAAALVQSHEVLRSTVSALGGTPAYVVAPEAAVRVEHVDLSALPDAKRSDALAAAVAAEAARPFDLAAEPPLRILLARLAEEEHALVVSLHRVAATGVSVADVVAAVTGAVTRPAETRTERGRTASRWRDVLAGAPVESTFPGDRRRPPVQSYRGAAASRAVSAPAAAALAERAGTFEAGLLAGLAALLARYTQAADVVLGFRTGHAEELPVRIPVAPQDTFDELTSRVAEELEAVLSTSVSLETLLEEIQGERDLSRSPLFQVVVETAGAELAALQTPCGPLERLPVPASACAHDLVLSATRRPGGDIELVARYARDLFDHETVERILGHLVRVLDAAAADPAATVAALPLLSEAEVAQAVHEWNATDRPFPSEATIHGLFERWADATPDAPAVSYEGVTLTYSELDRRANSLASALAASGVERGTLVALCLDRSLDLFVAVLGVLKAGAAYVPLDPAYPRERLEFMLSDCEAPVLLTHERLRHDAPQGSVCTLSIEEACSGDAGRPGVEVTADDLAYVIYTSGSTGHPKGVLVEHRGACNLAVAHIEQFGLGPGSRVLQFSSLSFDACVWEMLMSLANGGELVLAPRESLLPGPGLVELLRERGITHVLLPPSSLSLLPAAELPQLRTLLVGGEACQPELVERWAAGRTFVNCYGPTETTVLATTWVCTDGRRTPPIGRPIQNVRAYVLDPRGRPLPIGAPGELVVGGVGVARGYLKREELTAERFLADPFVDGARVYRTGDIVRRLPGGELEYLGRVDDQVKIRGFRIEIGEIEAVLSRHPQVADCVVLTREDTPGDKRLVAYLAHGRSEAPTVAEIRGYLRRTLPEHFMPSAFVILEALPHTPAKKIDRAALPQPVASRRDLDRPYVAPRTPLEELAARLFGELLGLERVGVDDAFFDLGGDSLRATQVASRLAAAVGVEIPLRAIFEHPTAAGLAQLALQHALATSGGDPASFAERIERLGPAKRAVLEQQLLRSPEAAPSAIEPRAPGDQLVLSFAQQRLWFLDQWAPGSPLYNAAVAVRLTGDLDREALRSAVDRTVERHEALRTTFRSEGGIPIQIVLDHEPVQLVEVDLTTLPPPQREPMLQQVLREQARKSFDLSRDVLIRPVLVRLDPAEHVLQLVVHHIASDGWSKGVLFRDLAANYAAARRGLPTSLPPLPIQYADFALWQRRAFSGATLDAQMAYWREALAGAPASIDLPFDRPRPADQSFEGVHQHLSLSRELAEAVRAAAQREGVTPYMFLLATFAIMLGAYADQDDVVVGTPIANRHRMETEDLIGFFVNTLVLRTDLSGEPTFHELVQRVREAALGAYAHQDMPFEQIVEVLKPRRHAGRNPLFQVNFRVQSDDGPQLDLEGLESTPVEVDIGTSRFDLALELQLGADGIGGYFEYSLDLFDATTVKRMAGNFVQLLNEVIESPLRPISELRAVADISAHRAAILGKAPAAGARAHG